MSPDEFETFLCLCNAKTFIEFLMAERFIPREASCTGCKINMNLVEYKRNMDGYAWRCSNKNCFNFKK